MLDLLLIGLAAFVCWAISVYVYPFRPCGRCQGTGKKAGSNRRRFGFCNRCGGTGRTQRIGSRTAHRTVLSVRGEMTKERRQARARKAAERAADPRHQ